MSLSSKNRDGATYKYAHFSITCKNKNRVNMQEMNGYFAYQNLNMNETVALLREYHQAQKPILAHELLHTYMAIPLFRESNGCTLQVL